MTSKRAEDALRIGRGVALILFRALADSSVLKRASRVDPELALQEAHGRAVAAAEAGKTAVSQVLQEAQQASPQQVVRQTQEAAQRVLEQTHGSLQRAATQLNNATQLFRQQARPGAPAASSFSGHGLPRPPSPAPPQSSGAPSMSFSGGDSGGSTETKVATSRNVSPATAAFSGHASPPLAEPTPGLPSDADRVAGAVVPGAKPQGKSVSPAAFSVSASSSPSAVQLAPHVLNGLSRPGSQESSWKPDISAAYSSPVSGVAAQPSAATESAAFHEARPPSADGHLSDQLRTDPLTAPLAGSAGLASHSGTEEPRPASQMPRKPRERRVPSSPFGRVMGFAGLGASLVAGTVRDSVAGYFQPRPADGEKTTNAMMTEANAERLANALCRMRGAALKLGQMISIQDENVLPPAFQKAMDRVRAGADIMPRRQLEQALQSELGSNWREKVADFDYEAMAAASIGQVHAATLHDGRRVAMKIQYPGVARSIKSDVDNLLRLIRVFNVLPAGMYVEEAAKVAKRELTMECDYAYEARCQCRFKELVEADPEFDAVFHVPAVVPELSTQRVLTTELVHGVHIDKVVDLAEGVRNAVGTRLLQLTLRELFSWRFMQTDPNWGNFLYDEATGRINLLDFGAAREYPAAFVGDYLEMVVGCANRDREQVILRSTSLGFLTGDESAVMLDAHTEAGFLVGVPFAEDGVYDFATHGNKTAQVAKLGAVMLQHRLTAPPEEAYSLHRKLSGAFLANIKLRAKVPCRQLLFQAYDSYQQQYGDPPMPQKSNAKAVQI